jgi:hypothetical protein
MICKCGNKIPEKRASLGYKNCVDCSTEEKWSAIPVIYHKTGNTVQVIKDPEVAKEMMALSRRTGFGTMRGMKPQQKSQTYSPKNVKNTQSLLGRVVQPDPARFERAGKEALEIFEYEGKEKAMKWLEKKAADMYITGAEMFRIKKILEAMLEKPEVLEEKSSESKWWYSKRERPDEKKDVSEEIDFVFKNWKR